MKRNFLFVFFAVIAATISAAEPAQGIAYYKAGFPQVAKPLLLKEYATDTLTRSETCFYLGNIYFGENKVDSAEIYFKKGLIGKQVNVLNTIGLAMLKMKSNLKDADADIIAVLKLPASRKNPDYSIAAANAYLFNGLIEQATNYMEKAKSIKLKYSALAVLAGDIEFAKKDVGKACGNYDMAILYDENCKEAYIKYARAYKNVNTPLAIEMLNRLKQKEPTFLLADKELADIYYANNDFDKAAQLYANYLKSGNSSVSDLTKYAMTIFLNKDYTKSLEISKMGLQKDSHNPAFNRLAMYNNVALEKYNDAIKYADLFFNKSDNPDISYYDYTYYGQALRSTKQYDLAIEQFKKALKLDSTQIGFWKDISDMYGEKPDYPNQISNYIIYMNALAPEKKTADIILNLGKMYYSLGNLETSTADIKKSSLLKADSIFGQVASLEPTAYRGNMWRARTNFALDPESTIGLAKPFYEQTVTLVEAKADVRYNPVILECSRYLGYYYFLKKDYVQSKIYWNKILLIDSKNELALKAIEGIDKALKGKK
jgi:tetratricopeptide (TPR) repeat protein